MLQQDPCLRRVSINMNALVSQVKIPNSNWSRLITVFLGVTLGILSQDATAQWKPTWQDEFDGPNIDLNKWDVLTRKNNFNNELQYYLPEQASIFDGRLRITSTDEPFNGKPYRSARLESNIAQAYGRFEIRAKIPTTKGIWPAIWLLPRFVPWPTGGEIDIMEHGGSQPTVVSSAYHWQNQQGNHQFVFDTYQAVDGGQPIVWPNDFHEYVAEWEPGKIQYYVDGVNHYTVTSATAPISSTPMHVILNTAVGGDFDGNPNGTTVFPQFFDIDYVRVYEEGILGDFNFDDEIGVLDWQMLKAGMGQDSSGMSIHETYATGDINQDFRTDVVDFGLFKSIYEQTNGAGSFAAMVTDSSANEGSLAPEPSMIVLAGGVVSLLLARLQCRRRRHH